jgi:hypothetical protein
MGDDRCFSYVAAGGRYQRASPLYSLRNSNPWEKDFAAPNLIRSTEWPPRALFAWPDARSMGIERPASRLTWQVLQIRYML